MNNKDIEWVYTNILVIHKINCNNSIDIQGRYYLEFLYYNTKPGGRNRYITDRMPSEEALLMDMQIIKNLIAN